MAGGRGAAGGACTTLGAGYLKAMFFGNFLRIYAFWVASRLIAGTIVFATVATERELLMVGMALCVFALLAWHVQWRRRRRGRLGARGGGGGGGGGGVFNAGSRVGLSGAAPRPGPPPRGR